MLSGSWGNTEGVETLQVSRAIDVRHTNLVSNKAVGYTTACGIVRGDKHEVLQGQRRQRVNWSAQQGMKMRHNNLACPRICPHLPH
jgi:hypothetical protein